MRKRSYVPLSRHTFKVRMADGVIVEVERWAPERKDALPHVENFVEMNWPGAKLEEK